eukprot:SAG11_NODE_3675_length_2293_cov_26.724248_2_plen_199_part_00
MRALACCWLSMLQLGTAVGWECDVDDDCQYHGCMDEGGFTYLARCVGWESRHCQHGESLPTDSWHYCAAPPADWITYSWSMPSFECSDCSSVLSRAAATCVSTFEDGRVAVALNMATAPCGNSAPPTTLDCATTAECAGEDTGAETPEVRQSSEDEDEDEARLSSPSPTPRQSLARVCEPTIWGMLFVVALRAAAEQQ